VNTLLTSLANSFAKPLLLAGVLPVVITFSLLLLVTYARLPVPLSLPASFTATFASWQVTWATLLVIVAGMLLQVLNTSILRFMSGYPWRHTAIGRAMIERQRQTFVRLRTRRDGLRTVVRALYASVAHTTAQPNPEKAAGDDVNLALTPLSTALNDTYPYAEHLILPTTLGNVIRNSEDYSRQLYGASMVRLWPRLVAVIEPRYATLLDEAKTHMDFMVNCSALFVVAAMLTMVAAWQARVRGVAVLDAGARVLFFVGLAALTYASAIERAKAWGVLVKASADLYRRALAKLLEYTYTFTDVHDESARFWRPLSALWAFPDLRDLPDVPFVAPVAPPTVTGASSGNDVPLTVARGITLPEGKPYATTTVTLRVRNAGKADATAITVVDPISAGWTFAWGSVTRLGSGVAPGLKSSAPNLELTLDAVPTGSSIDLTYRLQSLTPTR
jgi:uncharacterized repeat protein (TIGR01451 family)